MNDDLLKEKKDELRRELQKRALTSPYINYMLTQAYFSDMEYAMMDSLIKMDKVIKKIEERLEEMLRNTERDNVNEG